MATRRKTTKRSRVTRKAPAKKNNNVLKIAAIAAGGYLVYQAVSGNKAKAGVPNEVQSNVPSSMIASSIPSNIATPPIVPSIFPLQIGSRGSEVAALQNAILKRGGAAAQYIKNTSMTSAGNVDGIFGSGTASAVNSAGIGYPVTYSAYQAYVK